MELNEEREAKIDSKEEVMLHAVCSANQKRVC
jgi:hypothetical protein